MLRRGIASTVLVWLLAMNSTSPAAASNRPMHALLAGRPIALASVSKYHCHNRYAPVIHCFATARQRDLDFWAGTPRAAQAPATSLSAPSSLTSVFYVTFYADINFGGASFTTSSAISNMTTIGWNDRISSFKSLNGERPEWWRDINFAGTAWRWPAGTWVSYVGDDANDQFSSVADVP